MALKLGTTDASKVFVGTTPAKAVYLGDTKVWPPKTVYIEDFTTTLNPGWTNFVGGLNTGSQQASGKAGTKSLGQSTTTNTYQVYNKVLPSDDCYLDITLSAPLFGTLDTGASGSPLYIRVRAQTAWAVGTSVEFMIRASGDLAITSFSGATGTSRATATGKSYSAGQVLSIQATGRYFAVFNRTTDPNMVSPLIFWTDTGAVTTMGANNRSATMSQLSNFPFLQKQYSCFAVDKWEYGEGPLVIPPYNVLNTNVSNAAIPADVTGCFVTFLGAGGPGNTSAGDNGGNGGGGGARIGRSWIPVANLGATYSVTRGVSSGASTVFSSGSITLTAGGGTQSAGGTASATGITGIVLANGSMGSNSNGAGARGGSGGSRDFQGNPSGGSGGYTSTGGNPTGLGGRGGTGGDAVSSGFAFDGSPGGNYGGGGGGGGAGQYGGSGGSGGQGYSLVEWIYN